MTMKKDDIQKLLKQSEMEVFTINPDIKTEISRKQIDGIVTDMKSHLAKNKMIHIILVKE